MQRSWRRRSNVTVYFLNLQNELRYSIDMDDSREPRGVEVDHGHLVTNIYFVTTYTTAQKAHFTKVLQFVSIIKGI